MRDLVQFFSYMNDVDFPYVVLRNWENLPYNVELGEHSDLDLLVYDLEHWREIFPKAKPVYKYPRVQFRQAIGDSYIHIDARHVGDDYYPRLFEESVLENRIREPQGKPFYVPCLEQFRVALAYHCVHHKGGISANYRRHLGDATLDELYQTLKQSSIGWVEPQDPSVGRLNPYWKGATSVVSREGGKILKKQTGWQGYDLEENEKRILGRIRSVHFPVLLDSNNEGLLIEDCGDPLTENNLPSDWRDQLAEIVQELDRNNVQHRDIKPDNLMVKNGIIKLIDFGWARFNEDDPDNPPNCLGFPFKPSYGFDDNFSMRKVIKIFQYKLEERMQNV